MSRADFLPGQFFDIRLEVHSPVNGSEARVGVPDSDFKFTISKKGGHSTPAAKYFKVEEPELERWNFTWYEGMNESAPPPVPYIKQLTFAY